MPWPRCRWPEESRQTRLRCLLHSCRGRPRCACDWLTFPGGIAAVATHLLPCRIPTFIEQGYLDCSAFELRGFRFRSNGSRVSAKKVFPLFNCSGQRGWVANRGFRGQFSSTPRQVRSATFLWRGQNEGRLVPKQEERQSHKKWGGVEGVKETAF